MKDNFPLLASVLWPLLTAICLLTILAGLQVVLRSAGWSAARRQKIVYSTAACMLLWVGLLTVLAKQGFFADFSKLPPRPGLAILIPLPVILFIAFSKAGSQLLMLIPPHWLLFLQSFRIFVELLLWLAFIAGKLPVQMTFEGRNFDVLTGLLALPVGYYIARHPLSIAGGRAGAGRTRKILLAFNVLGIALLLNVLVIAVLSMPTPLRHFMNEPANTLIGQFPFIFLPGVLVPLAYGLHILSLRQLFLNKKYNGSRLESTP